ncbi:MAG: DUF2752 domain-containing protein, partial [Bryobacteraceae bacterium]
MTATSPAPRSLDAVCTRADHTPLIVALAALAQLLVVRLAFWSDGEHVFFLGAPFGTACSFRTHFGIPCPGCGLTRSVVLTLQGDLSQAMGLNPMGPAAVLGLVLLSAALRWVAGVRGAATPAIAYRNAIRLR